MRIVLQNQNMTENQPDDDLLELGSKTLDEIFEIYSAKLDQLRMMEQSLATTERAGAVFADLMSRITPANDNNPPPRVTLHAIEAEIISRLAREPESMYQMHPRYFEELICALLVDMGLDVHLTPRKRDGGRDILAVAKTSLGHLLTVVECKRYKPENKIGVKELRSFLFTVRDGDRASCGLFATTSFFSRDADRLAAEYAYQLKLRDFGGIKEWLENYGRWTEKHSSGIWLPHPPKKPERSASG